MRLERCLVALLHVVCVCFDRLGKRETFIRIEVHHGQHHAGYEAMNKYRIFYAILHEDEEFNHGHAQREHIDLLRKLRAAVASEFTKSFFFGLADQRFDASCAILKSF